MLFITSHQLRDIVALEITLGTTRLHTDAWLTLLNIIIR